MSAISSPQTVSRINAETGDVFDASTDEIRLFEPYLWSEAHDRFIVGAAGGAVLLEPETGRLETIRGETRPLSGITWRPLQPTGKANEVWAIVPGKLNEGGFGYAEVAIGRYDLESFGFIMNPFTPSVWPRDCCVCAIRESHAWAWLQAPRSIRRSPPSQRAQPRIAPTPRRSRH